MLYFCLNCGNSFNKKKKYCNNTCQNDFQRKEFYKKLEEKQEFPNQNTARTYLLYKNGNKCEICDTTEWQGKLVPLVMDHINGNSDDNSFSNCRLICRNCDGLLPTYCKGNYGNGGSRSKERLKNYYKGKKKY